MFDGLKSLFGIASGAVAVRGVNVMTATDYGRDILANSPDGWEVDQQWLWWVDNGTNPPDGNGTPGYGNPPPDARNLHGATAIPALMRATSLIADTIAGLPWRVYRGFEPLAVPRWISDPQLTRPDGRMGGAAPALSNAKTAVELRAEWITSALWFGDGYLYAINGRGADGQLRAPVVCLNPQRVEFKGGGYWTTDLGTDEPIRLNDDWLIHLRGAPPYGKGTSRGIIGRYGAELGLAGSIRNYACGIFRSGIPSGYLKVNAPNPTEPQVDALKARWMGQHGGSRRSVAVLGASTDFVPISISPVDAELGAARDWSLRDIALMCGVPAYMLGAQGDSSTYANVESRMTELRTFTLLPWIRRIEAALDAQFAAGTEVKIVTEGTLRADTSTRYDSYAVALKGGWLTVDEIRALEDRPPLPSAEPAAADPDPDPELAPPDASPLMLASTDSVSRDDQGSEAA